MIMLKLDEVTNPLRENERMMRNENSDNKGHAVIMQEFKYINEGSEVCDIGARLEYERTLHT